MSKPTRAPRIYLVKPADGSSEMLVRAKTKQGAIGLVASSHFEAALASQDDLVRLASAGTPVIDGNENPGEDIDQPLDVAANEPEREAADVS